MFAVFNRIYNFLFAPRSEENNEEKFLIREILMLEIQANDNVEEIASEPQHLSVPDVNDCLERTGVVTYLGDGEGNGLLDGNIYFEYDPTIHNIRHKDKLRYLCYKSFDDNRLKFVRIIQNLGLSWGDDDDFDDEKVFKSLTHVLVEQVEARKERIVKLRQKDICFDLDTVESTFIPVEGDWLELTCIVKWDEQNISVIKTEQVLKVLAIRPLRSMVKTVKITQLSEGWGICDNEIYFDKHTSINGFLPQLGALVVVHAIESNQGSKTWRAIKLIADDNSFNSEAGKVSTDCQEEQSLKIENEKRLKVTYPICFQNIDFNKNSSVVLNVSNNSDIIYTLLRWKFISSKRDSQLTLEPIVDKRITLNPAQKLTFNLMCKPKVLGQSQELLVFSFEGFQVKRMINISVVNEIVSTTSLNCKMTSSLSKIDKMIAMHNIRNKKEQYVVPGEKLQRTKNFVKVKLGMFPIPDKIWDAVIGDHSAGIDSNLVDYKNSLSRIERMLPCLNCNLNTSNYNDRWHTLLYIEEIENNINMRQYDLQNVFLKPIQEYLTLEITGLCERRPSLIIGDRVIVKGTWEKDLPAYEGFIHSIKGNTILMKFHNQFHQSYSGYDVSVEFHFSRTAYRRCHQGIKLAITNLGPEILFPSRAPTSNTKLRNENITNFNWFNKNINERQKTAVTNILRGVCRPIPYCIFGPPGTGKTITVVESILQILMQFPESRILVATPSNSAANLLTERLLQYKDVFSCSLIRLIANYLLGSDTLPSNIKPYCATLDIAIENTASKNFYINSEGVNLNCQSSFIERYRIIIGTCVIFGALAQMELPKGHFTHVIVDEAGQATEPEIMIPLTFVDKRNGIIILSGDPLQLGPVVLSKYAKELGLEESYLDRLLNRFPYQKDYKSYKNGYDERLITRLTDNYRSLETVIRVPSDLFYDSCLVPKFTTDIPWVRELLDKLKDIIPNNKNEGGICVYGVKGKNIRAEDSPSWYNPQEAVMILMYACKLYKRGVLPEHIGIITPYLAQIKYLRQLFDATGVPMTKIGTVEEFQGQERPIILISTVRSTKHLMETDLKFTLGFVKNPKRLNVALTRAMVYGILFCNPHLLCRDVLWRKVIEYSVENNTYSGCDLPLDLEFQSHDSLNE